jgi:hypothetical protein
VEVTIIQVFFQAPFVYTEGHHTGILVSTAGSQLIAIPAPEAVRGFLSINDLGNLDFSFVP